MSESMPLTAAAAAAEDSQVETATDALPPVGGSDVATTMSVLSVPVPAGVQVDINTHVDANGNANIDGTPLEEQSAGATAVVTEVYHAAAAQVVRVPQEHNGETTNHTTTTSMTVQVPYTGTGATQVQVMDMSSVNVNVDEQHTLESDQVAQIANLTAPNLEPSPPTLSVVTQQQQQQHSQQHHQDSQQHHQDSTAHAPPQARLDSDATSGGVPSEQQTWHGFFMQLQAHATQYKTLSIEPNTNPPLEAWVSQQRAYYQQQKLHDATIDERAQQQMNPDSPLLCTETLVHTHDQQPQQQQQPTESILVTTLSHERQTLLDALGFQWDETQAPHTLRASGGHYSPDEDAKWKQAYQLLVEYKAIHGHPNVAETYKMDLALGKWVAQQRAMFRKETLPLDRLTLLKELGFDFTPGDKKIPFQTRLEQLTEYKQIHGDTRVPRRWSENPGLGEWLHSQKKMFRKWENGQKGAMTDERRKILLDHGVDFSIMEPGPRSLYATPPMDGTTVTPITGSGTGVTGSSEMATGTARDSSMPPANRVSKWDEKFHQLKQYKTVHGHSNVPRRSKRNPQHDALGEWVHFQRRQYRNLHGGKTSTMSIARKKALELLGFQWSRTGNSRRMRNYPVPTVDIDADLSWDERYLQLETYYKAYGHSNVQENWMENPSLTLWCNQQRESYHVWRNCGPSEMTQERFGRLQALGFDFDAKIQLEAIATAEEDEPMESEPVDVVEVQMVPLEGEAQVNTVSEETAAPKVEVQGDEVEDTKADVEMPPITPDATGAESAAPSLPSNADENHPVIDDEEDLIEIVVGDEIMQEDDEVDQHSSAMDVESVPVPITPVAAQEHEINESDVQDILEGKNQTDSDTIPQELTTISTWEEGHNHLAAFVKEHGHAQVPHTWVTLSDWINKQRVVAQQWRNGITTEDSEMNEDKFVRLAHLGFNFESDVGGIDSIVTSSVHVQATNKAGGEALVESPPLPMSQDQNSDVPEDVPKENQEEGGSVPQDSIMEESKSLDTSNDINAENNTSSGTEVNQDIDQSPEVANVEETQPSEEQVQEGSSHVSEESSLQVRKRKTMLVRVDWEERYLELVQYKLRKGNCNIPPKWKPNPGLADWVRKQRHHYLLFQKNHPSVLSKTRIDKLNNLSFQFLLFNPDGSVMTEDEVISEVSGKSPKSKKIPVKKRATKATPKSRFKEGKWLESLSKVVAYKEEHGSCNVPRKWKQDPTLGEWVHFQRRQFRLKQLGRRNHMTEERIQKLEAVGFEWSRGSPNPPTYMRIYEENKDAGNMAEQFIEQAVATEVEAKMEGQYMDNVVADQMHQIHAEQIAGVVEAEPAQMESVISELTEEHVNAQTQDPVSIQTDQEKEENEELIEV